MISLLLRCVAAFLSCGLLPVLAWAGPLDFLGRGLESALGKSEIRVFTVTDTTPAGAQLRPATPDNPVYYVAIDLGFSVFGGPTAGEHPPQKKEVSQNVVPVLAKQGYLLATKEHPPTLVLLWRWGTMNVENVADFKMPLEGAGPMRSIGIQAGSTDATMGTEGQERQNNQELMLRFLGADKLGLVGKSPGDLKLPDADAALQAQGTLGESLLFASTEHLDVVAIAAYDYAAFKQKEKRLLWTTRISCPSPGLDMAVTFPNMIAIAGPNIGRETPLPVLVTSKIRAEVKIGELTRVNDASASTSEAPPTVIKPAAPTAPPA